MKREMFECVVRVYEDNAGVITIFALSESYGFLANRFFYDGKYSYDFEVSVTLHSIIDCSGFMDRSSFYTCMGSFSEDVLVESSLYYHGSLHAMYSAYERNSENISEGLRLVYSKDPGDDPVYYVSRFGNNSCSVFRILFGDYHYSDDMISIGSHGFAVF